MLDSTDDAETKGRCYLGLGQLSEQEQDYGGALEHYAKGLALGPSGRYLSYFLHNNSGYCLNVRGNYKEAEAFCRAAIAIDAKLANGYKNLGISLAGQNELVGAAWAWTEATKADARDPRSYYLLETLLADHPEVMRQFPAVLKDLESCSQAVDAGLRGLGQVQQTGPIHAHEICLLKYVPGKGFSRMKDGVQSQIAAEEIERLYTKEALKMLGNYPNTWCSIVGEDKERASEISEVRIFDSRSGYLAWRKSLLPALVLETTPEIK